MNLLDRGGIVTVESINKGVFHIKWKMPLFVKTFEVKIHLCSGHSFVAIFLKFFDG